MSENLQIFPQNAGVHEALGITVVSADKDKVVVQVPVGEKVHQPYGILHGGVSVVLAESAASMGAAIAAGPDFLAMGIEINASHLRSMSSGMLTATAVPIRVGRTLQVWNIDLTDEQGHLVCVSRCSVAIRPVPGSLSE
jgi:uncharacterized protein (TIGR00369 family)